MWLSAVIASGFKGTFEKGPVQGSGFSWLFKTVFYVVVPKGWQVISIGSQKGRRMLSWLAISLTDGRRKRSSHQ
jgi:hypothetical protein